MWFVCSRDAGSSEKLEVYLKEDIQKDGVDWMGLAGFDRRLLRRNTFRSLRPRLIPDNVSSIITKIFKEDIHQQGVNWNAVPGDHKNKYYQKFKILRYGENSRCRVPPSRCADSDEPSQTSQ